MGMFDGGEDKKNNGYDKETMAKIMDDNDDIKAMTQTKGWEVLTGIINLKIGNLRDMIEFSGAKMTDSETKHTLGRLSMAREIMDLPRLMNETAVSITKQMDEDALPR